MAVNVTLDYSSFKSGLKKLDKTFNKSVRRGVNDVANEVLRLSSFEVPHDTGALQNSGHVEDHGNYAIVGYNKVYAAKLHESPQFNYQKGRKAKYLEDPIKNNLTVFQNFLGRIIKESLL